MGKTIAMVVAAVGVGLCQTAREGVGYGADEAQRMDLRMPAGKGFAVVIFVHGGSLTSGDKADTDYQHVCDGFPGAGIGCVNVNYRLGPQNAWPSQPEDVAAAAGWVRAHAAEYGGDPRKLFLLGHSSGAMLVALVGSDERYLGKVGMKPAELRGVMPMGSIMTDEDLAETIARKGRGAVEQRFQSVPEYRMFGNLANYEDSWPLRHVHAGMPPFLFLIAEAEKEQPPVLKTDGKFVEAAQQAGNEADYRVFAGRRHYTMIRQLHQPGDAVFSAVVEFVRAHGRL